MANLNGKDGICADSQNIKCKDLYCSDKLAAPDRLLRASQAIDMLGISRSLFYRLLLAKKLPQGYLLSARVRVWLLSDIEGYITRITTEQAKALEAV